MIAQLCRWYLKRKGYVVLTNEFWRLDRNDRSRLMVQVKLLENENTKLIGALALAERALQQRRVR